MKSENKIKIGTLCSAIFIIISYLLFRTDLPKIPNIFLYNLVIIIAFQGLGFYRGLFFLGGSIFLTILASLAMNFHYVWNVPVFFVTFMIVDNRIKKIDYFTHIIEARIEELRENTNLLTNEYSRHKREAIFLEKREQRYKSLKDVTSVLSSTLSMSKVTELILDNALEVIGKTESLLLFLVDIKRQELNLVASRIDKMNHVRNDHYPKDKAFSKVVKAKKGDLLDEWVFKQRQCLLVEDIKKDFRFSDDKTKEYSRLFRSVISCPLMEERKVVGITRMEHSRPNNYILEDLRLLDILCDLGAASLQNAKLYKQTLDLAITDGLTGLYLRRYFLDRLKEELSRSLRSDLTCSFLMIDIDDFKNYNDKYGHTAGDIVLKTLSKVLKRFGQSGIVARYGGEEFSMLLPETPKRKAKRIAEDIRKTVKEEIIELRRVETHISISIGVSSFPEDAKVQDDLIQTADERLYIAKRQGKDRVVVGG